MLAADGRDPKGQIVAVSPALADVPVTSVDYDGAAARRDADARDLADANHRIATDEARLNELEAERTAIVELIARNDIRERKLAAAATETAASLRTIVVERFVQGSDADHFASPEESVTEQLNRSQRATVASVAESTVEDQVRTVDAARATTASTIDDLLRHQRRNESDIAETTTSLTRARSDADLATAAIAGAEAEIRAARPMTEVTGSDLPLIALDAYWRAARDLATTRPNCGIAWWAIAGVGRVESNHGRSSGGQPGPDGTTTVPVYGIPLDGTNGTKKVPDTDKGAMDLDPDLDRAVGVMQFLPGTWKRWAEDQSGDRTSDPQNIYDAALAAGKLLCSASSGLDGDDGLRRAYLAYNHSDAYVEKVLGIAHDYSTLPVPPPTTKPEATPAASPSTTAATPTTATPTTAPPPG